MADFRKWMPVFAVLALILGLTTAANAQFSCQAGVAVPNQLRYEGLTELTGDLLITCTGSPNVGGGATAPGTQIPLVNITVFLGNTTVTSRLLDGNTNARSEAVLMLDDPSPANQVLQPAGCTFQIGGTGCNTPPVGNGAGLAPQDAANGNKYPNLYQGYINTSIQPNAVTWNGIPIDPPGTTPRRIIRISNIRINANAIGTPSLTAPPIQAVAFISAFPSTALPITNNAQQVVGTVQRGLSPALDSGPTAYQQCVSANGITDCTTIKGGDWVYAGATGTASVLKFTEVFASAFKVQKSVGYQDTPGSLYGTESGFYSAVTGANAVGAPGVADFGTRFKAIFNNVPTGSKIYVPNWIRSDQGTWAVLVSSETAGTAFGTAVPTGTGPTPTAVTLSTSGTAQTGMAVYEVVTTNTQVTETFKMAAWICYTASPGTNSPGIGTGTVSASFAPTPPAFDAAGGRLAQQAANYPIPRFVDTSTPLNIFSIATCATNLLFPFVTNQAGFDTGIAISNTSLDNPVFATTAQTGTCTLYPFGPSAPAAVTSAAIAGGNTYTALLSSAMPNFQGYIIARCLFQYAHGFAFISDIGARNLAMGYLALVIPDLSSRPANPNSVPDASRANTGEQLGN